MVVLVVMVLVMVLVLVVLVGESLIVLRCLSAHAVLLYSFQHTATKFVQSVAESCIPNYPDRNLPSIFVYNEVSFRLPRGDHPTQTKPLVPNQPCPAFVHAVSPQGLKWSS